MSTFDPMTLFSIVHASMGVWLWLMLALALVLLAGIVTSALKLYRADLPMRRPLTAALVVGLIAAIASTFAVPAWTLADLGALSGALDYAFAFTFALVPGAIVGALVFMLAARRCANQNPAMV